MRKPAKSYTSNAGAVGAVAAADVLDIPHTIHRTPAATSPMFAPVFHPRDLAESLRVLHAGFRIEEEEASAA